MRHPLADAQVARVQDRSAIRRLPVERLHSRQQQPVRTAVRGLQHVEPRTLRATVANIEDDRARQFALNVQVPVLHVAERVVAVGAEVVGQRPGGGRGETVLQRKRARRAGNVGGGGGKRRLVRHLLDNAVVRPGVVTDAVAGAHHGFLVRSPGDAHARREVVAIRIHQRRRELARKRTDCVRRDRRNRREARRSVEVHDAVEFFAEWLDILVTQA